MLKLLRGASSVALFTLIWVVLNENASVKNIFYGFVISLASIKTTSHLLGENFFKMFSFPIFKTFKYLLYLFKEVYIAGIITTRRILTGKINPNFMQIDVSNKLKKELFHRALASSITLTPGTIALSNKNGKLNVLVLNYDEKSPCDDFVERLSEIENEEI